MEHEAEQAQSTTVKELLVNKNCPQDVYFCPQACYLLKYKLFWIVRKNQNVPFFTQKTGHFDVHK